MQAAHRLVELGPGHVGVTLGVDQPFLRLPGLGEQFVVHLSTVTRRLTVAKQKRQRPIMSSSPAASILAVCPGSRDGGPGTRTTARSG